jgi:hypothetical protein
MTMSIFTEALAFGEIREASPGLRVVEFGGRFVPDEGLVLTQPSGETLLVWPDGKYVFTQSEESIGQAVISYYNYVLEDAEGNMTSGAFSPGEALASAEAEHGLHGWSLQDILALNDMLLSGDEAGLHSRASENEAFGFLHDAESGEHPFFSTPHQNTDQEQHSDLLSVVGQSGIDFTEDVLAKMLMSSSEG